MKGTKYRVWDKEKKIMLYSGFVINPNGTIQREWDINKELKSLENSLQKKITREEFLFGDYFLLDYTDWYGIENYELMEYTGFNGLENNEIYEGDLITGFGFIAEVWYKEVNGRFQANEVDGNHLILAHKFSLCKKIGNKYENPELLEK